MVERSFSLGGCAMGSPHGRCRRAASGACPVSRAQSADSHPAALSKQRAAIFLKATHAPLADLESDVNHLAVLSETCRVEYGAQACGLPDKPLESGKLEDAMPTTSGSRWRHTLTGRERKSTDGIGRGRAHLRHDDS